MASAAQSLESRLFRRFWDDGLLDVLAGIGIAGIGVSWALELVALGAIVPAVLAALWPALHGRLIEPRAGHVEFSDARVLTNRRLAVGSVIVGVGTLLVFVGLYLRARSGPSDLMALAAPGTPSFLLGLLGLMAAWMLGAPRFIAYAGVLSAAGAGVSLLRLEPAVGLLAAGAVVTASGTVLLFRFLRLPVETA